MKNFTKKAFLLFIAFLTFNVYILNAEEVNENIVENSLIESETNSESEKTDLLNEDKPDTENPVLLTEENEENKNEVFEDSTIDKKSDNEEEKTEDIQDVTTTKDPTENLETQDDTDEIIEEESNPNNEQFGSQKAKDIISKKNTDEEFIVGAKLQILDSSGNVLYEWISGETAYEVLLPNGTYTLHEEEAPKGYKKADDQEIIVDIEVEVENAGVVFDTEFCTHHLGIPLYYVTVSGEKQEVYCINQNWEVPDEMSEYDGGILSKDDIRNFTRQTVAVDAAGTMEKIDISVSEDELSNEELYDKILDIIYHRHKATTLFNDIAIPELRYLTEAALKNYTNAGLTEVSIAYRKYGNITYVPLDAEGVLYDERSNGNIFYLRHQYRDFVYTPDAELGKDIYKIDFGKGNSFGQLVAYHWSAGHNAKNDSAVRARVARYYEVYNYLIGDDNNDNLPDHPSDMNLYIYSSGTEYTGQNPNADYAYQNLLGVTGYFDDNEGIKQEVVMYDEYSDEKRSISVEKVWNDKDNYNNTRPTNVIVNLEADGEIINRVELSEDNQWQYTFEDLDVYNKGKEIQYSINEVKVPKYDSEIEGDMNIGFVITNTYYEGNNPPTVDNIVIDVILLLISIYGIFRLSKIYIKSN